MALAVSEQQEAVVPAVPEQQGACRDPVTLQGQGQSESSGQPRASCKETSVLEGLPYGDLKGSSQK